MKRTCILPASLVGCGVAAIVLGLASIPLAADDKEAAGAKGKDTGAPDMEEMMKKMEELAAPGSEHSLLASLAGEWETEARCYMSGPDAAPTVSHGATKGQMILGGRFLQEEFKGDMMGKQFQGVGLTGYDKFNKKFIGVWMDSMGTGVFVSEGTCDAGGKVLTMHGKMDDPMTGEKQKPMRLVTRILNPDKHVFEMYDEGEAKSKVMEITYVRKGSTSAGAFTAK